MTTHELGGELQELLDHHRIRQCLARYARGVDRLDDELLRSAFHEDAIDCHGPFTATREELIGHIRPMTGDREATQHFLGQHHVELEGDTANVETYFFVVAKLPGSDQTELVGGRYVDQFERRDGEWRISLRIVALDWQLTGDASGMAERLAPFHRGSRDRDDPSYERPLTVRSPAGQPA
jgi:3-phenylpropionate/cinnamic acid dioxygenase small subunit